MSEAQAIAAPEAAPVVPSVDTGLPAPDAVKAETADPSAADAMNEPEAKTGDDEKPEKPKPRASERISELYGRMKAAERERDQAFAEVNRLRQPFVSQEQFDQLSFEQQQAVQVRQAVRQERAEELHAEAASRAQAAESVRAEMFVERCHEVARDIPGLIDAISSFPVSQEATRLITEMEKGPQVAYWLSQNQAEALRIARLPAHMQAFELGRVEQRISAAPTARKVSNAPAPVPKVGSGAGPGPKDAASMSTADMAEFLRGKGLIS